MIELIVYEEVALTSLREEQLPKVSVSIRPGYKSDVLGLLHCPIFEKERLLVPVKSVVNIEPALPD
jgi:hypothetical protein